MSGAARQDIGILTFHRCINYGSYWQARCLAEGLRAMGYDAVLMDHRSARIDRREWTCALGPVPGAATPREDRSAYAAKARRFFEAFEHLPTTRPFDLHRVEDTPDFDVTVVGSDEVWNLRHPWYGGQRLFFGEGISGKMVSYAASFGSARAEHGLARQWATRLQAFAEISVRDDNSRRLVREAVGSEPEMVLDPCLQFSDLIAGAPMDLDDTPFLAVYGHSFPDWFVRSVRRFASVHGLRLISIGYRNDWADQQWMDAGPLEFATLMQRAAVVATNFFHGCVFSLVSGLPFVCAPSAYRNTKVRDLLYLVGEPRRLLSEQSAEALIDELLAQPPPFETFSRIEAMRKRSERYLKHALH